MSSEFRGYCLGGGSALSEETTREEGFVIFKNGTLRRLSPTHYIVKSQSASGWNLVELKDGVWTCDCNLVGTPCAHVYSTRLHRYTSRQESEEPGESHLKCRHCSSIDVAGCGFRYGARGISRRYYCRDCQRKFSIPYVDASHDNRPNELAWLLNEVGMLTTKLTELIALLNSKLDSTVFPQHPAGLSTV
jgi:hypothetical protein